MNAIRKVVNCLVNSFLSGFFVVAWCLLPASLPAQVSGKLLLMNGKVVEVENFNDTTFTNLQYRFDKNQFKCLRIDIRYSRKEDIPYKIGYKSAKGREVPIVLKGDMIDRDAVFSFVPSTGSETVYYFYDEPLGNIATIEEMRAYVYGERDARFSVSGNGWFYSGMAVGLITGYAARGSILALAVPPVFALSARIPVVRIKEESIQDVSYKFNEDYAAGYESYARGRFTRQALLGSAIGTLLGLVTYAVVDNNF